MNMQLGPMTLHKILGDYALGLPNVPPEHRKEYMDTIIAWCGDFVYACAASLQEVNTDERRKEG